ncbi:GEM-like protein 4 [Impatiens glandulifera]|uniref:GEM-like protein 4 n=1 Tax=Impatiens glandulifera TaxID=253017 RepID=UPI001FB18640|nr:GEM-like protein 4 [Impatiens glandulifera]
MNSLSQQMKYFTHSVNAIEMKRSKCGLAEEKKDNDGANNILIQLHARERSNNISTTLKRKLRLGATILQNGGLEKLFKRNFIVTDGERLVTTSQCYLSTTAGPIVGLLFISSEKIGFLSERSIKLYSPNGHFARAHYKVMIPLAKTSRAIENKNINRPAEKYIEIVTVDNFDFWFLGFSNYRRAYKNLQRAISQN